MNQLRVITQPTRDTKTFDVFWMTGLVQKGRIEVVLQFEEHGRIAAELCAIHYLLTQKNACGHDKTGAGLCLQVSCEEILHLLKGEAEEGTLARYANFLRTRFIGAEVSYDEGPYDWADLACEARVDFLRVFDAPQSSLEIPGIGTVEVTAHAVDQYLARFQRKPTSVWRDFQRIAKNLRPMSFKQRSLFSDLKHRSPGIHLIDEDRKVVAVIAKPDGMERRPRWVTVFAPDEPNIQVLSNHQATEQFAAKLLPASKLQRRNRIA